MFDSTLLLTDRRTWTDGGGTWPRRGAVASAAAAAPSVCLSLTDERTDGRGRLINAGPLQFRATADESKPFLFYCPPRVFPARVACIAVSLSVSTHSPTPPPHVPACTME